MNREDKQCIILAAGKSQRFGSHKLLYPLDNTPLILLSLKHYLAVFKRITVVVREGDKALKQCLLDFDKQHRLKIVECPQDKAEMGMSQSLIAGLKANQDATAWLIGLADMPYIQSKTIQAIVDKMTQQSIVVPEYTPKQQRGNPVAFGSDFKQALLQLNGARGGASLIKANNNAVAVYPTDDKGVIMDIDQKSDIVG